MFSPVGDSASLRNNPRRRRRNDGDTHRQPRKRSRIASDTFSTSTNGHANGSNGANTKASNGNLNGYANGVELAVREKRIPSGSYKSSKDTTSLLTRNPKFSVTSLPCIPDKLKKPTQATLRASIRSRPSSSLAVSVTLESILIWDCTVPSSSPAPRVLSLPYPAKSTEQLPLAGLVSNASKDLGLVLVYPTTGKITYWEDIDSAESLKLFEQRRHGVEGTLKLSGGEHVQEIIDVESAGLVLLTTSGRLAHLTLQDTVGQPQVTINFLQQPSKGSFFGDLVQVFQTSSRNRLNAVKTRPVAKGRVEIITITEDGIFKIWEVREGGQSTFLGDIESSADIRDKLENAQLLDPLAKAHCKFLDLAIIESVGNDRARISEPSMAPVHALVLLQIIKSKESLLYILETTVANGRVDVSRIFPIEVYQPPKNDFHATLILPAHTHTAFIVLDKSVIVMSIPAKSSRNSYDEKPALPSFFQDIIHIKAHSSTCIISATAEAPASSKQSKRSESSILLFLKPAGMLKISAQLYNGQASESRLRLPTALNKLEQAVFFGGIPDNLLDLYNFMDFGYSSADMEAAALALSSRILNTGTDYLPQNAPAMDAHLTLRMRAMHDLAEFLKKHCSLLSRSSKWKLLGDAEKLASARAIWKMHDARIDAKDRTSGSLLEEGVDRALERHKLDTDSQAEDQDDVRHFFTKDTGRLERIFPYCISLIKERSENGQLHTADFLRLAPEMNALIITGLHTAYTFRQKHIAQYGLGMEVLEEGVLAEGYKELHRFWTADKDVIKSVSWAIKLTHDIVSTIFNADGADMAESLMAKVEALAQDMDQVIRLSCKSYVEGYHWLIAQSNSENHQQGLHMKTAFENEVRHNQIAYLYGMGQGQRGLSLAEDLEDVQALVELSLLELDEQKSRQRWSAGGKSKSSMELERIEKQIGHYTQKFGQRFAIPFYQQQMASHRLGDLIDKNLGSKEIRTDFLRSDPSYGKIAWINEILNENDMAHASESLLKVAHERETNLWSQKLELSIAKLALKCLPEDGAVTGGAEIQSPADHLHSNLAVQNDRDISLVTIQERLYRAIQPAVAESIDEQAAIDNVMQLYGSQSAGSHPSLTQVLKLGVADLISHRSMSAESLIDVLTLIHLPEQDGGVDGQEYLYALKVLHAVSPDMDAGSFDMLRGLIWKRCIVTEDWNAHRGTADLSDEGFRSGLVGTLALQTIKSGVKEGFFTPPLDAAIPLPSAVLGAGSSPSDFFGRFKNNKDLCGPIASDNAKDDEALQKYLQNVHLDDIWATLKELAMQIAEEEAEEQVEQENRYANFVEDWVEDVGGLVVEEEGDEVNGAPYHDDYIKEEDETDEDVVQGIEGNAYETAETDEDVEMED